MDQQDLAPANKTIKPNRSVAFTAAIVIFLLLCMAINTAINTKNTHYTNQTLALPELEDAQEELEEESDKSEWQIVTTQSGDSMALVFKRLGLGQQALLSIIQDNPHSKNLTSIKPGQKLQFKIINNELEQLVLPLNATQVMIVSRNGNHYTSKINSRETNSHNQFLTATVQGSLYGTAKRLNLPYKLMQQMTDIFNWEIDFARDIRAGDRFSILYNAYFIDDKMVGTGDILAVTYTNRGRIHQAIRHEHANGEYGYYSPQGTSLIKAFTRYPLKFSHISSTFSLSRKHPVLHYSRPHKGIDLAAPLGTPIHATGDGYIKVIGRQSDYGNMIKIEHNKTYSSIYGHMVRFQKGLSRGSFVKRGQVIGYVGQTGLATGPHCHYEFHVNNQPRNPATIELPRGASIPARELAAFRANKGQLLASLKLYEEAHFASNSNRKKTKTG